MVASDLSCTTYLSQCAPAPARPRWPRRAPARRISRSCLSETAVRWLRRGRAARGVEAGPRDDATPDDLPRSGQDLHHAALQPRHLLVHVHHHRGRRLQVSPRRGRRPDGRSGGAPAPAGNANHMRPGSRRACARASPRLPRSGTRRGRSGSRPSRAPTCVVPMFVARASATALPPVTHSPRATPGPHARAFCLCSMSRIAEASSGCSTGCSRSRRCAPTVAAPEASRVPMTDHRCCPAPKTVSLAGPRATSTRTSPLTSWSWATSAICRASGCVTLGERVGAWLAGPTPLPRGTPLSPADRWSPPTRAARWRGSAAWSTSKRPPRRT